jgi:hypothetical protein
MSNGVLLFANNNDQIDYVKQSVFLATQIKRHMNCGVAIATDSPDYLKDGFTKHNSAVDHIIPIDWHVTQTTQYKRFRDGTKAEKSLMWKNTNRSSAYELTPFDQTIVLDTDVMINNAKLQDCFQQPHDFLIDRHPVDVHLTRYDPTFDRISDKSVQFFWATAFFFRKTNLTKMLFETIGHVKENYNFYRMMYQIQPTKLRNDFVFSIAIHILNGFQTNPDWPHSMPARMFMTTDKDILHTIKDDKMTFLLDKETHPGQYTVNSVKGVNVHCMNKFSLGRCIDEVWS